MNVEWTQQLLEWALWVSVGLDLEVPSWATLEWPSVQPLLMALFLVVTSHLPTWWRKLMMVTTHVSGWYWQLMDQNQLNYKQAVSICDLSFVTQQSFVMIIQYIVQITKYQDVYFHGVYHGHHAHSDLCQDFSIKISLSVFFHCTKLFVYSGCLQWAIVPEILYQIIHYWDQYSNTRNSLPDMYLSSESAHKTLRMVVLEAYKNLSNFLHKFWVSTQHSVKVHAWNCMLY